MFGGWDWGSIQHGVCLIDDGGAVVGRWLVSHRETELAACSTSWAGLVTRCGYRSRSSVVRASSWD